VGRQSVGSALVNGARQREKEDQVVDRSTPAGLFGTQDSGNVEIQGRMEVQEKSK